MAQQHAHVPKFGNWDNDGNLPYTQFFENARKGKGGVKMFNPNDPAENPEAFSTTEMPSADGPPASDAPNAKPERRSSREGGSDALSRNPHPESPYHRHAVDPVRRAGRATGGDRGGNDSPLHPNAQGRADSSESSYGLVSNSDGRLTTRGGVRGNETPTRGSEVPKFGAWDKDPSSADGYTHIFNKVREEKHSQAAKLPAFSQNAAQNKSSKQDDGPASSSCSCFGLFK